MKKVKKEETSNMKCVFCNAILSNITVENIFQTEGCDTCGYGATSGGTIIVKCDKCDRVIYTKDFENG